MTHTPINLALNAVYELFSTSGKSPSTPPKLKAYTDDSSSKLEELVGKLNTIEIPHPVLIRMGTKEAKKRHPYAELLQQTLEERHLGASGSIHSIVADLLEFYKKSTEPEKEKEKEREPITNFNRSKDLRAGDIEIYIKDDSDKSREIATKDRQQAENSLLNWAQLESCLKKSPKTSFSRLAGGIRPRVYVFDDYNNFIADSQAEFYRLQNPEVINTKIKEFYGRSSSSNAPDLESAIRGFGRCLNTLSLVFDVKAPDIKFDGDRTNRYEIVAEKLDFQRLDPERNQIAAFIIDLEWLPQPDWIFINPDDTEWGKRQPEEMGHIAIRLLTQRYPEIPCFVFTGLWSIEILQKSLAAGAAWCFQKPISHHIGSTNNPEEELNYFNLERHLTEFAQRNYGGYQDLPNPQQFDIETNPDIVEKLDLKMSMKLSENDDRAKSFRKLIAGQFTADSVNPIKVLNAGKSGALATFFAQPTNNGEKEATRFVKIDSWLNTQTEYFAYQHIIRPRLNNHVAHIIQKPSVNLSDASNSESIGAITSSLAGFPEDYSKLSTLKEIIDRYIDEPGGVEKISSKICTTLELVLLPLYQNSYQNKKRYWLGEEFSYRYKGKIISLIDPDNASALAIIEHSSCTEDNIYEIIEDLDKKVEDKQKFRLRGWSIHSIDRKRGGLILYHRLVGGQIALEVEQSEFKRFSSLWLKPRTNVDIIVKLDSKEDLFVRFQKSILKKSRLIYPDLITPANHSEEDIIDISTIQDIKIALQAVIDKWVASNTIYSDKNWTIPNPFERILNVELSSKRLSGSVGVIHGDLNLNNILYPEGENVGFLIDFAKTKNNGLVAFDVAWLEVHIWNKYVFPEILVRYSVGNTENSDVNQILFLSLKSADGNQKGIHSRIIRSPSSPLSSTLKIIDSIRDFTQQKLPQVGIEEQHYCLGVSFLRYSKFPELDDVKEISDKINVLSFLAAAYYLSKMPKCESN